MKELQDWARKHPYKTVTFLSWAALCGIVMYMDDFVKGLALFVGCYGLWALVFAVDTRRLLCVLVAATMMTVPTRAHAVQYALGGVILLASCGIGYVGCRAVKCAKRIARPAGTNAAPEEFIIAGGDCDYGAAFFWPEEDCYQERNLTGPQVPVVFTMQIFVGSVSNITTTLSGRVGSSFTQTLDECRQEEAGRGLVIPVSPQISESYARNRHPVTAEQVPIAFDWTTRTATIGDGGIIVTVEASNDLKTWRPLMAVNVAPGTGVEVADVSNEMQFYRVTTR